VAPRCGAEAGTVSIEDGSEGHGLELTHPVQLPRARRQVAGTRRASGPDDTEYHSSKRLDGSRRDGSASHHRRPPRQIRIRGQVERLRRRGYVSATRSNVCAAAGYVPAARSNICAAADTYAPMAQRSPTVTQAALAAAYEGSNRGRIGIHHFIRPRTSGGGILIHPPAWSLSWARPEVTAKAS
jgi:hypothetical protein